jgi:hypothetical protein
VLRQALAAGHEVTAFVRTPSKLPPEARGRVSVRTGDLSAHVPLDLIRGQDGLINCAGHIADGDAFVGLFDRLVTGVDSLPAAEQPVCWFLAGAALLDIDSSGRRGVDLPKVRSTYWPHRVNFERLSRSRMDWRLLCPGPMVDESPLGLDRLRISLDALPVKVPVFARSVPSPLLVPVLASLIPQMIVRTQMRLPSCSPTSMVGTLCRAIASGWRCRRALRGRKSQRSAKSQSTHDVNPSPFAQK